MAVVVQAMLAPRAAGVLFTASPFTLATDVMILEASPGAGENVVSGKVTPDYFEISTRDGFEILTRAPGSAGPDRAAQIGAAAAGQPRGALSIEDASILELCALGRDIERSFGRPQDIEWALQDDGRISILQSRPISRFSKDG